MEEQKDRVSFRIDKKSEALSNVRVNKFGHTTTGQQPENGEIAVNLRLGGVSGVDAHVDIFDSPTMKKFMQQNNLNLSDQQSEAMEIIDLSEEEIQEQAEPKIFERPHTLEEFDLIADEILGVSSPSKNKKTAEAISDQKLCTSCNCANKPNSKFCSHCGRPLILAAFCKNCGNKFDNQEKFCSECGTKRE
jgi:hypothetical protein